MEAKVKPQIWNDPDFRTLGPDGKLAFIWLLSNWSRNIIGLSVVEKTQFEFETGVSFDVLLDTICKLGHSLCVLESRQTQLVLVLNFVSHQISAGKLSPQLTMGKSVITAARALPGVLRDRFCERYPLLKVHINQTQSEDGVNHDTRVEKSSAEQSREGSVREGSGEGQVPSDIEVFAFSKAWPGEPASGLPVMDLDWAASWLARMLARAAGWPPNWKRAMVACWREDWRRDWQKKLPGNNGVANGTGRADGTWGLKQRLEELRHLAGTHPGNRDSSAYVPGGPEALEVEYEKICSEIVVVEGKMAGKPD